MTEEQQIKVARFLNADLERIQINSPYYVVGKAVEQMSVRGIHNRMLFHRMSLRPDVFSVWIDGWCGMSSSFTDAFFSALVQYIDHEEQRKQKQSEEWVPVNGRVKTTEFGLAHDYTYINGVLHVKKEAK